MQKKQSRKKHSPAGAKSEHPNLVRCMRSVASHCLGCESELRYRARRPVPANEHRLQVRVFWPPIRVRTMPPVSVASECGTVHTWIALARTASLFGASMTCGCCLSAEIYGTKYTA
eukprot:30593-Chlamydomonas_euryale.AAC.2